MIPPADSGAWRDADAGVVATLAATALVIGLPILTGGWLTYFDNPAHLAEIHSLAGEGASGWSRIGFCGLSLDTLHSPLWWRSLAVLAKWGAPLEMLYAALTCVGLAAPAIALYAVARRRCPRLPAAALAYLLLIQRPALVGTSSATGGMWTFYLACAALIGWPIAWQAIGRAGATPRCLRR